MPTCTCSLLRHYSACQVALQGANQLFSALALLAVIANPWSYIAKEGCPLIAIQLSTLVLFNCQGGSTYQTKLVQLRAVSASRGALGVVPVGASRELH